MTIETGATAPQFTLPDTTDGEQYDLTRALERGPAVVGIYKSSCEASKTMFQMLEQLRQAYPDQGLSVWGVAQDSANVSRSFIRRVGVSFPILVEGEEYPVSREYDIEATPTVFLINQQGEVVWQAMGFEKPALEELSTSVAGILGTDPVDITGKADDVPSWVPG